MFKSFVHLAFGLLSDDIQHFLAVDIANLKSEYAKYVAYVPAQIHWNYL